MTNKDQCREAFEEHVLAPNGFYENGAGWVARNADGTYRHENIQARWTAWQAARSAPAAPVELPEPDAYLFQHEETGRTMFVDAQQVEWGFEANNPRLKKISGVYTEQHVRELLAAARRGCEAAENLPETRMDTGADRGRRVLPEWLPIESAPKDKTILLGYRNTHGNWQTLRGEWFSREEIDEFWEDPDGVEPGWFETSVEADDVPNVWRTEPTHWMPLPQPPKEQG